MSQKRPLVIYGGSVEEISSSDQINPSNLGSGTRNGNNFLRDDGAWVTALTTFSFTSTNGVDGVVLTSTTTPTLSISLSDITPSSVVTGVFSSTVNLSSAAVTIVQQGSGKALDVTGSSSIVGSLSVSGVTLIGTTENNGVDSLQVAGSATIDGDVNFSSSVNIGSTSQLYSSFGTVLSTSTTVVDSFSAVLFRSAKYQIQIADGTNYETMEVFVIHDGTNVFMSTYGNVFNISSLGRFDASLATNTVSLTFTADIATNKTIRFIRTTLEV